MQGDSLCPTAPGDYQPTPAGLNQAITDTENLRVQNNQGTLIQITAGDFMQDAKVIISKPEKKGKSNALHLTLSDGKVTHDACFPPIDERKVHAPAPSPGGETDLNFRDYWGHPHPEGTQSGVREVSMKPTHSRICASFVHFCHDR